MRLPTTTVAAWKIHGPEHPRDALILEARSQIAQEAQGDGPAQPYMEVPDNLLPTSGRPVVTDGGTRKVAVTIGAAHLDKARELGDGNVSAGIRLALECMP